MPSTGPVIVYFHGNAMSAGGLKWLHELFPAYGFAAIEFPGYGALPGEPTEESIVAASEAQLKALGLPNERIILLGQSIGTGPAVEMAKRGWGTKLVLVTPFTSLPEVGASHFGGLPVRWLMLDRFESAQKAPGITMPVLVVHGDRDEVIPYALGAKLAPLFPHGELFTVPRGTHNDLWDVPEVVTTIGAFMARP
ncbi:MAG: alpha/beta hydrolase [Myxococcaceae bacterium]|nr:alpha/beta hydrolase [Myxococcaceae bacterium]